MVTANVGGCSTRQERRKTAASNYDKGKSRHPYSLKRDIKKGMALIKLPNKVCDDCQGLSDLKDIFDACKHSGPTLRKRKVLYPRPVNAEKSYRDIKSQNQFLLTTIFDAKGNFLYHRDCVREVFGVGSQRLSRLHKIAQKQVTRPFELISKVTIIQAGRISDVMLPADYEKSAKALLSSVTDETMLPCQSRPARHGNSRKPSNHAKDDHFLQKFLLFVDTNSTPNGRKEGSTGKTYYFDRKFSQIRTPDKNDPSMNTNVHTVYCMNLIGL